MVIVDNISEQVTVKLPNNLIKSSNEVILKNTETKKTYTISFEDTDESDLFYIFAHQFTDLPVGEYEYEIDGNKGLLRVGKVMDKKVYDENITFKSYEG